MARAAGISATTVHKLWAANDLKPHLTRTFKVSNDPQFEGKFWDVIGLYLAPPDNDYHFLGITIRATDPVHLEHERRGYFEQDSTCTRCDRSAD